MTQKDVTTRYSKPKTKPKFTGTRPADQTSKNHQQKANGY